jgi:hypothetical protein
LSGGQLHLALNCDPNTVDRESVQAAKQFHLHLLYWTAAELAALSRSSRPPSRLADETSAFRRRQCMDPLGFLGAHVMHRALSDFGSVSPMRACWTATTPPCRWPPARWAA